MLTTQQKDSILYQAQLWIAETGYGIMEKEQYSQSCDCEYLQAFEILNYMSVLLDEHVDVNLTAKEQEKVYTCIQISLGIQNYPVAQLLTETAVPIQIQVGTPGPAGPAGAAGANGTNANIVVTVEPTEDGITVREEIVGTLKTYYLSLTPYIAGAISVSLDDAVIIDPDQARVTSVGRVIATLQVFATLIKGRENVTASTVTAPAGLDLTYQGLLNLTTLNASGSQVITLSPTSVSTTTTYTININDGTTVNTSSATVTFVYPFLYGNSATTSPSYYTDLTKLVQTKANKTVALNAVGAYFWFGYPSSYGNLVQVLDQNGFDVTADWTVFTPVSVISVGLDVNFTHDYTFYRTTAATTINGNFTFKFTL